MKLVGGHGTSPEREVIDQLAGGPFADPLITRDLKVASGASIVVPHGLGYRPRGWMVLRKNAPGDLYEDYSHTSWKTSVKIVNPGANEVTFDLAVLR